MNPSEATEHLFQQYGDEVYRYVRFILGSEGEAEDVVQEIFVQVMRSWNRFEHRSDSKTWLWAVANNMIKRAIHEKRRNTARIEVPSPTSDFVQESNFFIDFEAEFSKLPLAQQQVFLQRIVHDMSSAQTAGALGWSESKVKVTLHRAVKRLRQWLDYGDDES